jgi:hypothetical protein
MTMTGLPGIYAYAVAIVSGAALWIATSAMSGRREAWDSPLYWTVAYPIAVAIAAALGYLAPERPWRWALTLMLVQALTLAISASSFGLLPLGLMMFGLLALIPVGAAVSAATIRKRRSRPAAGSSPGPVLR